jgi:hypothetical protein
MLFLARDSRTSCAIRCPWGAVLAAEMLQHLLELAKLKPTLKSWQNRLRQPQDGDLLACKCKPSEQGRHRSTWSQFMKHLNFALALLVSMFVIGCGAGHANLTSITVSPESATTTSSPQGQVGYTATGHFANGKSRELSQVDGLSWKTSQTSTGTVAATIGSTGEVTCSAPGTVTITASAPQNLSFTVNNGVQNTSMTVSGTATLTCQ